MYRQMMSQATRRMQAQGARGYASASGDFAKNMTQRAQALGTSVFQAAERALGSYAEPIIYNLRVAGSLAKQVYIAEKLAPPTSVSQVTSAYQQIWSSISKASWWAHSLPAGEWRKIAVYGVEAVGIFSIGEIVREAAFAVIWHAKNLHLCRSASAVLLDTRSRSTPVPTVTTTNRG